MEIQEGAGHLILASGAMRINEILDNNLNNEDLENAIPQIKPPSR